jgi:hypothetical protein
VLRAKLGRVSADRDDRVVHVVEGGKQLATTRHNLVAAKLTVSDWCEKWVCARYRIEALGSGENRSATLP